MNVRIGFAMHSSVSHIYDVVVQRAIHDTRKGKVVLEVIAADESVAVVPPPPTRIGSSANSNCIS